MKLEICSETRSRSNVGLSKGRYEKRVWRDFLIIADMYIGVADMKNLLCFWNRDLDECKIWTCDGRQNYDSLISNRDSSVEIFHLRPSFPID